MRQCNDTFWPRIEKRLEMIRVWVEEINENKTRGNERLIYVDRELIRIEGTVNSLECCGRFVFVKIVAARPVERRIRNDTLRIGSICNYAILLIGS